MTRTEIDYVPNKMQRIRSAFTMMELNRLTEEVKKDPWSLALLLFYIHTGCRNNAANELLVDDVYDRTAGACRPEGVVLEKFGEHRRFDINPILGEALVAHIMSSGVTKYVFPVRKWWNSKRNKREVKGNISAVLAWFKKLCAACNFQGDHCFIHAIRRSVITILVEAGNKIEDVSSWVGHKHIAMTQHYVEKTPASLSARMCLPWMQPALAGARLGPCTFMTRSVPRCILRGTGYRASSKGSSYTSSSSSSSSSITTMPSDARERRELVRAQAQHIITLRHQLGQLCHHTGVVRPHDKSHTPVASTTGSPPTCSRTCNGSNYKISSSPQPVSKHHHPYPVRRRSTLRLRRGNTNRSSRVSSTTTDRMRSATTTTRRSRKSTRLQKKAKQTRRMKDV